MPGLLVRCDVAAFELNMLLDVVMNCRLYCELYTKSKQKECVNKI